MIDDLLNFPGIDVDTVDQQHVFLAVSDEIVSVPVVVTHVACQKPTVAQRPGGFLRLVPVTLHHVAASHANLADLTWRKHFTGVTLHCDFDAGNRDAYGAGFPRSLNWVHRNDRTGFAQTVTFNQRDGKLVVELLQVTQGDRLTVDGGEDLVDEDGVGRGGRQENREERAARRVTPVR